MSQNNERSIQLKKLSPEAINEEMEKAKKYMKQNNVPEFHMNYTLETVKSKLESGKVEIVPKLLSSSVKIYRSLYKKIQTRKSIFLQIAEEEKNYGIVSDELIGKLKECTRKLIRDFGHWTKVINFSENTAQKRFIHNGQNYIEIVLTDNKFLLEKRQDYASLQYNPLFLKKGEETLQQYEETLQVIQKLKLMINLNKKQIPQNRKEQYQEQKQEEKKEEKKEEKESPKKIFSNISEKKQKSTIKYETQKQKEPMILEKADLNLLKKYQSLAGSRIIHQKYKTPNNKLKEEKSRSRSERQKSPMDSYLQKLSEMKTKIQESPKVQRKKPKKQVQKKQKVQSNQPKQELLVGLSLIDNVRENRIRLIAQKVHQKHELEEKPMGLQAFDVMKSRSITKISFYDQKKKRQTKKSKFQTGNLKSSHKKLNPLENLESKKLTSKKQLEIDRINESLKNLKGRIRISSGLSPENTYQKSYFKTRNSSPVDLKMSKVEYQEQEQKNFSIDKKQKKDQKIEKLEKEQPALYQSKIIEKEEKIQEIKKQIEKKSEKIKGKQKEIIEKENQELNEQKEKLAKTLYDKKKQLESIIEDIENENIQKVEQINHEKLKQKKIEANILEKKYKIQQLQERVKDFENASSDRNEEDELKLLQVEKKKKMDNFEKEKLSILKEAKEIEERMLNQEQKFVNLKEKQMQIKEADIEEKYAEINKNAVAEMEEKTKKLQKLIQQEQEKRKMHEQELNSQMEKNIYIQKELEKQNELQELLIKKIQAITRKRSEKRQSEKQRKKQAIQNEILQLQNTHKQVLLEYQRDSQRLNSMFEAMRKKNQELQAKIKLKSKDQVPE